MNVDVFVEVPMLSLSQLIISRMSAINSLDKSINW